jgi:hypothetical protein
MERWCRYRVKQVTAAGLHLLSWLRLTLLRLPLPP